MSHVRYNKIHSLDSNPAAAELLDGEVVIQEKIDGANFSIWWQKDELQFGSRNHAINQYPERFADAKKWIGSYEPVLKYLKEHPTHRLFGEWLVKHSIKYDPTVMQKFYLFDIMENGCYHSFDYVNEVVAEYGFLAPRTWFRGTTDRDEILKIFTKSALGAVKAEGVVIRSLTPEKYKYNIVKLVTSEFEETREKIFGANLDKMSNEEKIAQKYVTPSRVRKAIFHFRDSGERIDRGITAKVVTYVHQDVLLEGIIAISKKYKDITFKKLYSANAALTRQTLFELLRTEDFNLTPDIDQ